MRLWARAAGILLAIGFVALLAYGLTTRAPDDSIDEALSAGRTASAPGFELAPLAAGRPGVGAWRRAAADGTVSLDELRGTPLVINLWASWCDPCRAEAPLLEREWRRARRSGVLFLGLDSQDAREDAREFIARFRLTFPHVRDGSNRTARRWGVAALPETFFLAADGRVVGHVIGTVTEDRLRAGIAAARAGRPLQAP
jgi:cytochrome c biogenesis protein CcmG, thiol:disulfide interchange protein DsbE